MEECNEGIGDYTGEPIELRELMNGLHISINEAIPVINNISESLLPRSHIYEGEDFSELIVEMKSLTNDQGVWKKVVKAGQISRDHPNIDDKNLWVSVKYSGYIENCLESFDIAERPRLFYPQQDTLVKGFSIALSSMHPLEHSLFIFRPDYFFGELGCEPRIPKGGCSALFYIELIDYGDSNISLMDNNNKDVVHDLKSEIVYVQELQQRGNELFRKENFKEASYAYSKAINFLESRNALNKDERELIDKRLLPLYLNAQQTALMRGRCPYAITLGKSALNIDQNSIKALYRLGIAYRQLSKFSSAKYYLDRVLKIEPHNKAISHQIYLTKQRVTGAYSDEIR
ncbi:hypothetical protein GJ496_005877 [Pomphorhynchus laevis]|nr:hypothetical protein GJ496_005877 [Pomphorhynchus laevis]